MKEADKVAIVHVVLCRVLCYRYADDWVERMIAKSAEAAL